MFRPALYSRSRKRRDKTRNRIGTPTESPDMQTIRTQYSPYLDTVIGHTSPNR